VRPVNLIPQEQRRRVPTEGSGRGAYVALGALAVLLVMAVAYVLTANTVTERQNQTETARAEADRLEAEVAKKGSFTDFEQIARTRMQSVASVAAGRFDWERFMRELSRVMPAGSWLTSADASASGAPGTSGTDGGAAAALAASSGATTAAGPSANLIGCTPDHSDVARMMVRLRQLYRVTDVQLRQATKESEDAEASIDSCGRNTNFDLTVTFSPTAPASEAPRGSVRVPASLGGGS
jgi:Tfp pilus assembly protein PilN